MKHRSKQKTARPIQTNQANFHAPQSKGQAIKPPNSSIAMVDNQTIQRMPSQQFTSPVPTPKNNTGLPDNLKSGIEALSGYTMDDVKVHYNSSKPAQLQAFAFTQGTDIHVAPGQEKHLPHEAWHTVQQKQGRVKPTMQMKDMAINDDTRLEIEASVMGTRANRFPGNANNTDPSSATAKPNSDVIQRRVGFEFEMNWAVKAPGNTIGMHQEIVKGTDWHAVPDMAPHPNPLEQHYTGWGNFEYVTSPFDENLLGRARLSKTLDEIEALTNKMEGRWSLKDDDSIRLSKNVGGNVQWGAPTPVARRTDIWIVRNKQTATGDPQMTAGIRLENISNVFDELGSAPQDGVPNIYGRDNTAVGGGLSLARQHMHDTRARAVTQAALVQNADMNAHQRNVYEGALAHLGHIVDFAAILDVGTNEKYLSPLLSRTNFGDLPDYVRNHPTLKSDVMIVSGLATIADWHVLRHSKLFDASPGMGPLTINQWLTDISNGNDPFQWGREGDLNRWVPQQVGSLPNASTGHVFEFRGISGTLPLNQWKPWALAQFDHVRNDLNN